MTIRTPPGWGLEQIDHARRYIGSHTASEYWHKPTAGQAIPRVTRIGTADLWHALRLGAQDFGACRTDVIFLCVVYPLVGLLLARLAFGYDMLPLLFPLASGFAIVGPFAAIGLYELSRRREEEGDSTWTHALDVLGSPAIGRIAILGMVLIVTFLLWIGAAQTIYDATLGPEPPASAARFVHDVLHTRAGWWMIGVGMTVGFLFALFAMTISVVAFPMLLDRDVPLEMAIRTSAQVVGTNPGTMAIWGLIVAAGLLLGSLPALLGLVVVLPILGHATWHLYRRAVSLP
jgi:uncharacterized membrane protein